MERGEKAQPFSIMYKFTIARNKTPSKPLSDGTAVLEANLGFKTQSFMEVWVGTFLSIGQTMSS